ncbi:MAG: DUF6364 family protein [Solirubrobacterales bacterium]
MANLTLSIDEQLLRRARIKALEQGTSVNALVRDYLGDYASAGNAAREAIEDAVAISAELDAGSGSGGRAWTRGDLYDRPERPAR